MPTTIQVSNEVKQKLEKMKIFARESYNEIIERMIEDEMELNEKTRKEIGERKKSSKLISHNDVKKRLRI